MNSRERGNMGEAAACEYLRRRNYEIVAQNYHSRYGEVDIIARDGRFIVFIEVKLRRLSGFDAAARDYVGLRKQAKLRNTAEVWLSEKDTEYQPRFDVIEIYTSPSSGNIVEINHIIDAF